LEVADELYAPVFVCHFPIDPEWRELEGVKQAVAMHRTCFPNWNEQIEDIIAARDMVVTRFTSCGTHQSQFQIIAPTGKQVAMAKVAIYRIIVR
jgi:predicted ester cyclase